jgi:cob(I)alamin adenosyltransferase
MQMATMGRLEFGRLTDAWAGEASDFTPLLADQLGAVGDAIQVDLTSIGQSEVLTAGGRRIDIVAEGEDGAEFVIENQYGRGDHDHLTRGLAYAVARRARGLVVIAEEHRDEFRAVAQYLNELADTARIAASPYGSSRRRRSG